MTWAEKKAEMKRLRAAITRSENKQRTLATLADKLGQYEITKKLREQLNAVFLTIAED